MPKNRLQELDEILAKSQRLSSQIADSRLSSQPLNYRVAELSEATRQLADSSRTATPSVGGVSSEAKRVLDEISNIALKDSDERVLGLEGVSLDNYLAHHHDMICLTALQASQAMSQQYMEDMQRRWLVSEWEAARSTYVESLGHRPATTPATPLLLEYTPQTQVAPPSSSSSSSVQWSPFLTKHVDIVQAAAKAVHSTTAPQSPLRPCADLLASLDLYDASRDSSLLPPGDLLGYRTLLDMLSYMTGENSSPPQHKASSFAPVCFERSQLLHVPLTLDKHALLTAGALAYYTHLAHKTYTTTTSSTGLGPRTAGGTLTSLVKAHIAAVVPPPAVSLYAVLYYFLRVGAWTAVAHELDDYQVKFPHRVGDVESHLAVLVHTVGADEAARRGPAGAAWATPTKEAAERAGPAQVVAALQATLRAYRAEVVKFTSGGAGAADVYKLMVCNVLACADKQWFATGYGMAGYVLEDFVWAHVCTMHIRTIYSRVLGDSYSFAPTSPFAGKKMFVEETQYIGDHEELLELVISYGGAGYFDANGNVFKYCMILLACHRFGDCVAYLHTHHKACVAAHLLVACLHYGLVLPHQSLACNPSSPLVAKEAALPHAVLLAFAQRAFPLPGTSSGVQAWQAQHVLAVCHYLAHVHAHFLAAAYNVHAAVRDVYKLKSAHYTQRIFQDLLTSLPVALLEPVVGKPLPPAEGVRSAGCLDAYFSSPALAALLAHCAVTCKNAFHDYANAFHFWRLAGEYAVLVRELVDLLVQSFVSWYHSRGGAGGGGAGAAACQERAVHWCGYARQWVQSLRGDAAPGALLLPGLQGEAGARLGEALATAVRVVAAVQAWWVDGHADTAWDGLHAAHLLAPPRGAGSGADGGVLHLPLLAGMADEAVLAYVQCGCAVWQQCQAWGGGPRATQEYLAAQAKGEQARAALRAAYHYVHAHKQCLKNAEGTLQEIQRLCSPFL